MTIDLKKLLGRLHWERLRLQAELKEIEEAGGAANLTLARIVRFVILEAKVDIYKSIMQAAIDSSDVDQEEYNTLYGRYELRP